MDRSKFMPRDSVQHIWKTLRLPELALDSLRLPFDAPCHPSSFKVDHLAQATIGLSALAAAQIWAHHNQKEVPTTTVHNQHACAEFKSERLYMLNGKPAPGWGTIGGLHKTADGYVRMHDSFPNHREHALQILGLPIGATRVDVAQKMLEWKSIDLEIEAFKKGAVIAALRSFEEWDDLPQAKTVPDCPILLNRLPGTQSTPLPSRTLGTTRCLEGIRVVEMSRVVAAPVCGKTLAAHGADVIWLTSPTLPSLPELDVDLSRGKRTVQLNVKKPEDKAKLFELLSTADVFLQSYRPGSLDAQGLSAEDLIQVNPNLIIASLNAYGPEGPWKSNRGFDSLVQTCSGLNVEDARRFGANEPARVLPCQALDHGAGYLLATGIMAALYRRDTEGGAYQVKVSLAGIARYLRSLGQYEGKTGFERKFFESHKDATEFLDAYNTGFGKLEAIRHSAQIEGLEVGWVNMPMPKSLGSDKPEWSREQE